MMAINKMHSLDVKTMHLITSSPLVRSSLMVELLLCDFDARRLHQGCAKVRLKEGIANI